MVRNKDKLSGEHADRPTLTGQANREEQEQFRTKTPLPTWRCSEYRRACTSNACAASESLLSPPTSPLSWRLDFFFFFAMMEQFVPHPSRAAAAPTV